MSLIAARATLSICSLVTEAGPRISPAITTRLVVASVSQAARICQGSMPAFGPSRIEQVDDLVGNAVADLVRMAFGHGLAGEQI